MFIIQLNSVSDSESSSIESLPPPPLPLDPANSHNLLAYQQSSSMLPPPPPNMMINHQKSMKPPPQPSHDPRYVKNWEAPPNHTQFSRGSSARSTLPRRQDTEIPAVNNFTPQPVENWEGERVAYGRQTPIHMMERSRSAGPHVWKTNGYPAPGKIEYAHHTVSYQSI